MLVRYNRYYDNSKKIHGFSMAYIDTNTGKCTVTMPEDPSQAMFIMTDYPDTTPSVSVSFAPCYFLPDSSSPDYGIPCLAVTPAVYDGLKRVSIINLISSEVVDSYDNPDDPNFIKKYHVDEENWTVEVFNSASHKILNIPFAFGTITLVIQQQTHVPDKTFKFVIKNPKDGDSWLTAATKTIQCDPPKEWIQNKTTDNVSYVNATENQISDVYIPAYCSR